MKIKSNYLLITIVIMLSISGNEIIAQLKGLPSVSKPIQAQSDTVELTSLARWPQPTQQVPPVYPQQAQQDHVDALVKLNVLIGKDGIPKKIKVMDVTTSYMKGNINPPVDSKPPSKYAKLFHRPSIDAVMKWRFTKPLKPDGKAALVWVIVPLQYQLKP